MATTLKDHWQDVAAIQLGQREYGLLAGATIVTLIAHLWAGWVWGWILADLQYPFPPRWTIAVYLKTNIAKYLPGNFWHFYTRVVSTQAAEVPLVVAIVSVVLEPVLMAAAALLLALAGHVTSWVGLVSLSGVLLLIHPRCLNPLLSRLSQGKLRSWQAHNPSQPPNPKPQTKTAETTIPQFSKLRTPNSEFRIPNSEPRTPNSEPQTPNSEPQTPNSEFRTPNSEFRIPNYPLTPLLGELGFLLLRSLGFLITVSAFQPVPLSALPLLVSGFSFAWLLGLVVPGAPGGLGVFEATAIVVLNHELLPVTILAAVGLYRIISTFAEVLGAVLAYSKTL